MPDLRSVRSSRASGIACYAADPDRPGKDLVLLARFEEGTTVWAHTDRAEVLEEAAADPAGIGGAAGYLWAAEAGHVFWDIVNLFVRPAFWGGLGGALAGRCIRETRTRGRPTYYGCALSPGSAALARSLGFREIFGETVSFWARP